MVTDSETKEKRSVLEQHIQTVIAGVLLALLLWNGNALVDLKDKVGRLEERFLNLQAQFAASANNHVTAGEWRREKEVIDERFARLEKMLERMLHDANRK